MTTLHAWYHLLIETTWIACLGRLCHPFRHRYWLRHSGFLRHNYGSWRSTFHPTSTCIWQGFHRTCLVLPAKVLGPWCRLTGAIIFGISAAKHIHLGVLWLLVVWQCFGCEHVKPFMRTRLTCSSGLPFDWYKRKKRLRIPDLLTSGLKSIVLPA